MENDILEDPQQIILISQILSAAETEQPHRIRQSELKKEGKERRSLDVTSSKCEIFRVNTIQQRKGKAEDKDPEVLLPEKLLLKSSVPKRRERIRVAKKIDLRSELQEGRLLLRQIMRLLASFAL